MNLLDEQIADIEALLRRPQVNICPETLAACGCWGPLVMASHDRVNRPSAVRGAR